VSCDFGCLLCFVCCISISVSSLVYTKISSSACLMDWNAVELSQSSDSLFKQRTSTFSELGICGVWRRFTIYILIWWFANSAQYPITYPQRSNVCYVETYRNSGRVADHMASHLRLIFDGYLMIGMPVRLVII